jgi:hypothetical protein
MRGLLFLKRVHYRLRSEVGPMRKLTRPEHNEAGTSPSGEVSELLQAWTARDRSVLDRLTPIVYDELHRLARRYMKGERPGHSVCHAGRRRQSRNRPSGLPHPGKDADLDIP